MQTIEHAEQMSEMAVDILFSEGDPFGGKVDRYLLLKEIRKAILKKLIVTDSDFLEEDEFQDCVKAATIH